jgi:hypothetical protein
VQVASSIKDPSLREVNDSWGLDEHQADVIFLKESESIPALG